MPTITNGEGLLPKKSPISGTNIIYIAVKKPL